MVHYSFIHYSNPYYVGLLQTQSLPYGHMFRFDVVKELLHEYVKIEMLNVLMFFFSFIIIFYFLFQ